MNFYNAPVVSIACIAYNQELYIAQTIEGFLMQKTTFPFEIIINDDASTDNTTKIIEEYAFNNPNLIFSIFQKENQYSKGLNPLNEFVIPKCKGRYIAICEGDDYWTDPLKLQKQVDFLEKNPDYGLVYSKVKLFNHKDNKFLKKTYGGKFLSIEDLFISNYIPTPTAVFRTRLFSEYLTDVKPLEKKWLMGDYPLWMYITSVSRVKFMDVTFSVYRILESSATHSTDYKKELLFVESYLAIKLYFMKELRYCHLENKIMEHYFTAKAHIYLFKNEQNRLELVREIESCNSHSFKIRLLKFVMNDIFLRKILKLYWST